MNQAFEIDGNEFDTLEGFYDAIGKVLIPGQSWGRNFDALDELLDGTFGTPIGGFVLIWKNSEISKARFGFAETSRILRNKQNNSCPENHELIRKQIDDALNGKGKTIFEELVELIEEHGRGGTKSKDQIELQLC